MELLIIGSGPAGMTASIYASRYKIPHVLLGELPGGLMSEAHKICNFPSEVEISGMDLLSKMQKNVEACGGNIVIDRVLNITKTNDGFITKTISGKEYEAKSILLATGTKRKELGLASEKKYLGKGVSYCATCDAMFYRNKKVVVTGSGNSAMTAALHLAEIAETVTLVVRGEELKGEVVWMDNVKNNPKIKIMFNTNIKDLKGEAKLTDIIIENNNQESIVPCDGLFIEVGSEPDSQITKDLGVELDEKGYIKINRDQSTNISGFYAAGDITDGSNGLHQIISACAEGAVATSAIFKYLRGGK